MIHGERYVDDQNRDFSRFIEHRLRTLDYEEAHIFYGAFMRELRIGKKRPQDAALLHCNDRYFLLVGAFGRKDARHPWLFERAREVEDEPDDCLDLWARDHYKSTIITYSGIIQEVLRDPNITIGIFSHTKQIASKFLKQIASEFEQNEWLKTCHPDVLWSDPQKEAPLWGLQYGLVVKRSTNPKESTIEAHGLVSGQPTSKHFSLRVYDDVVTRESVTNPEQVKVTTEAWELSDNLGGGPQRKWHIGTRYSFADTYGVMLERKLLKPRLFPATHNGRLDGTPVFLKPAVWENKKRIQASQVAAQMLQNPLAGTEQMFQPTWLKSYMIRPRVMTCYIMGDPSKGTSAKSDRTAIACIGIDAGGNKYLLDGYRHRMSLSERWENLKNLYQKWTRAPGIQSVQVGYERYGLQSDDEYFRERMELENFAFPIEEVSWTREGDQSKRSRVERLQPDIQHGNFLLPALVYSPGQPKNLWSINAEKGHPELRPLRDDTKPMAEAKHANEPWRIANPIVRKDEEGRLYDLTRAFIEEAIFFPFGTHDDLLDAASRIYDMTPIPPIHSESDDYVASLATAHPDA
jgi:phage terminase large subunit-like protein